MFFLTLKKSLIMKNTRNVLLFLLCSPLITMFSCNKEKRHELLKIAPPIFVYQLNLDENAMDFNFVLLKSLRCEEDLNVTSRSNAQYTNGHFISQLRNVLSQKSLVDALFIAYVFFM